MTPQELAKLAAELPQLMHECRKLFDEGWRLVETQKRLCDELAALDAALGAKVCNIVQGVDGKPQEMQTRPLLELVRTSVVVKGNGD